MLTRRKFLVLGGAGGLACLTAGCAGDADAVTLQGSGATFPAPLYKRWFLEIYKNGLEAEGTTVPPYDIRVNYQPIGSGAGTRQFREGLTDFGASDAVKPDDLTNIEKDRKSQPLAVPMTAGTVVLGYNIPPLARANKVLLLTRQNLMDILLGKVNTWDDDALTKLNPELKEYRDKRITWVRRSEGSGTTAAFTKHLAAVAKDLKLSEWEEKVGKAGKSIKWQVGIGAKGNDGVAAIIGQTPGALGYIEYGYAGLSNLPIAGIQNKAGKFVQPKRVLDQDNPVAHDRHADRDGGAAKTPDQIALTGGKRPTTENNFVVSIADPEGADAYPIITYTWLLTLKTYRDSRNPGHAARTARGLRQMIEWCLTKGQEISAQLDYIPLTPEITGPVIEAVRQIGVGQASA